LILISREIPGIPGAPPERPFRAEADADVQHFAYDYGPPNDHRKSPTMIKRLVTAAFLAGLVTFTVGCNTMEGIGEDLQSLGDSIEGAASKNKGGD